MEPPSSGAGSRGASLLTLAVAYTLLELAGVAALAAGVFVPPMPNRPVRDAR
jgi:hypothetical protein